MEGSYLLPGTKEKPNRSGRGREELVSSQISPPLIFKKNMKKDSLGPHFFIQVPLRTSQYQVKITMMLTTSFAINPSLLILQNNTRMRKSQVW